MSKKLMSLVLAVEMVMSVFCVAFSTSAAADEAEVEKVTYYFYAPPVGLTDIRAYWWSAPDAPSAWPGVEMTAVPDLGKGVYKVDVSTEAPFIIFNGQMPTTDGTTTLAQTVNVNLGKEESQGCVGTGLDNVANMCFVVTGQDESNGQFTGAWCSFDPDDQSYFKTVAQSVGYPEDDTVQAYIPGVDEVFVHGEDLKTPEYSTYYFYAPAAYGTNIHAHWWSAPDAPAAWPGSEAVAAPEIGDNVYKITMTTQAPFVIFNGNDGAIQTDNINLAKEDNQDKPGTGVNNVANRIFVITGTEENNQTGVWCSLDPNDDDYYRTVAGVDNDSVTMPVVPPYHGYFLGGVEPEEETGDEPVIEGIQFYFRADGTNFSGDPKKTLFYIWDATSGQKATKNGWVDGDTWGSKKLQGTEAELEGETLVMSYPIEIDSSHDVFVIINDTGTGMQTFDCVLTSAADGKILEITGNMLENPVDSTKEAIEAAFIDAEGCGPHKVVTSSCHVVGTALAAHDNPVQDIADKVAKYVCEEASADWTYEAAQDVMAQFQVANTDVWDVFVEGYGEDYDADQIAAAKKVILGEEDVDTDTTDTADESDTDTSKETDDTATDTETDTTGKETDDTATDTEDTDSAKETDDTATDTSDTDTSKETEDTATDTSDTDTTGKETEDTADTATDTEDTDTSGGDTDTSDTDTSDTDTSDTDTSDTDTSDTDTSDTDTSDTDSDPDKPKTKKALCGDVNEDGVVDSADALLILRASADLDMSAEKYNAALADVNGDGVVDSGDAVAVLRYSVSLSDDNNKNVGTEVEIPA